MSTISASTTSTTAYVVTADTTGTLVLKTGASPTTAVTFDANQNMGLGVTPSAWGGSYKAIQFTYASIASTGAGNIPLSLSQNSYYNGTNWIAGITGPSKRYEISDAGHLWFNGASATAGNAITFTQAMTLDASGNLMVGGTSVYAATLTSYATSTRSGGIGIRNSAGTAAGGIFTASAGSGSGSTDVLVEAAGYLGFNTGGTTERARINSSGSFLVGTTTDYATLSSRRTTGGAALYAGQIVATNDTTALIEQTVAGGNNNQNIGLVVRIQAQGTADRILACQYYNSGSPQDKMYVQRDGACYNTTGTWGTISDARIKQDITDASSQWEDFKKIKFRKYRLIDDVVALADEAPYLMGPVAQELEEAGMNGLVETPTQVDGTESNKQVKLSIMYMKGMKALQEAMLRIEEQQAIIETLTNRITALEAA